MLNWHPKIVWVPFYFYFYLDRIRFWCESMSGRYTFQFEKLLNDEQTTTTYFLCSEKWTVRMPCVVLMCALTKRSSEIDWFCAIKLKIPKQCDAFQSDSIQILMSFYLVLYPNFIQIKVFFLNFGFVLLHNKKRERKKTTAHQGQLNLLYIF